MRNKNFRESLEDEHPSLDASVARPEEDSGCGGDDGAGADLVSRQLDELNTRYGDAGRRLTERLKELGEIRVKTEEEEEQLEQESQALTTEQRSRKKDGPDVKVSSI